MYRLCGICTRRQLLFETIDMSRINAKNVPTVLVMTFITDVGMTADFIS